MSKSSPELVKLYYRIGEVARIVGVQPHVLRYWETEFRTIRPQKSSKGQRIYSRRDVEKLLRVKDLLKNQGFTIAGAKRRLRQPEQEAEGERAEPESASAEVANRPDVGDGAKVQKHAPKDESAPVPAAELNSNLEAPISASKPLAAKTLRKALVALRRDLISLQERFTRADVSYALTASAERLDGSPDERTELETEGLIMVGRKGRKDGRPDTSGTRRDS